MLAGCVQPPQLSVKKTHNFLKSCHCSNPFKCCSEGFSSSVNIQHLTFKSHKRNPIHVSSEYGYPSKPEDQNHVSKQLRAFYLFSRPHTIIGTVSSRSSDLTFILGLRNELINYHFDFQVIGITSVSLLPLETISDLSPAFFVGLLKVRTSEKGERDFGRMKFWLKFCFDMITGNGAVSVDEHLCGGLESDIWCWNRQGWFWAFPAV